MRRFEIGCWIRASAQGQGDVSEAVQALTRMAFSELQARRVEIRMDEKTQRSRAVAERCGFELEGKAIGSSRLTGTVQLEEAVGWLQSRRIGI